MSNASEATCRSEARMNSATTAAAVSGAPTSDHNGIVVAAAVQATRTEMSVAVGLVLAFLFTSAALSVHAALTLPDSAHRFPRRRRVTPFAIAVAVIVVGSFFVAHVVVVRDEPLPGIGNVPASDGAASMRRTGTAAAVPNLDARADITASCVVIAFTLVCGLVLFLVRKPLWIPSSIAPKPGGDPLPRKAATAAATDVVDSAAYVDQSSSVNPMPSSQVFALAVSAVTAQLGFEFALFVNLAGLQQERQQQQQQAGTTESGFFGRATFDFLTDTTDGLATLATVVVVAVYVLATVAVHTVILFRDHPRFLAAARSIAFRNTKVVQVQTLPTSLRRRRAQKSLHPTQRSSPPPPPPVAPVGTVHRLSAATTTTTTTTATATVSDDDGAAVDGPSMVIVGGRQGSIVFTAREQDEEYHHHHHSPAETGGEEDTGHGLLGSTQSSSSHRHCDPVDADAASTRQEYPISNSSGAASPIAAFAASRSFPPPGPSTLPPPRPQHLHPSTAASPFGSTYGGHGASSSAASPREVPDATAFWASPVKFRDGHVRGSAPVVLLQCAVMPHHRSFDIRESCPQLFRMFRGAEVAYVERHACLALRRGEEEEGASSGPYLSCSRKLKCAYPCCPKYDSWPLVRVFAHGVNRDLNQLERSPDDCGNVANNGEGGVEEDEGPVATLFMCVACGMVRHSEDAESRTREVLEFLALLGAEDLMAPTLQVMSLRALQLGFADPLLPLLVLAGAVAVLHLASITIEMIQRKVALVDFGIIKRRRPVYTDVDNEDAAAETSTSPQKHQQRRLSAKKRRGDQQMQASDRGSASVWSKIFAAPENPQDHPSLVARSASVLRSLYAQRTFQAMAWSQLVEKLLKLGFGLALTLPGARWKVTAVSCVLGLEAFAWAAFAARSFKHAIVYDGCAILTKALRVGAYVSLLHAKTTGTTAEGDDDAAVPAWVVAVFAVALILHVAVPVAWGAFMLRTCRRAPSSVVPPAPDAANSPSSATIVGVDAPSSQPPGSPIGAGVEQPTSDTAAAARSPTSPCRRTSTISRRRTFVAGAGTLAMIHNIQGDSDSHGSPTSPPGRLGTNADGYASDESNDDDGDFPVVVVEPATPPLRRMRDGEAAPSEPARAPPSLLPPLDVDVFNGNDDGSHGEPGGERAERIDNDINVRDGVPSPMRREESDPIIPGFMPRRRSSIIVTGTADNDGLF